MGRMIFFTHCAMILISLNLYASSVTANFNHIFGVPDLQKFNNGRLDLVISAAENTQVTYSYPSATISATVSVAAGALTKVPISPVDKAIASGLKNNNKLYVVTDKASANISVTLFDTVDGSGMMFFPKGIPDTAPQRYYEHIQVTNTATSFNSPTRMMIGATQTTNIRIIAGVNGNLMHSATLNAEELYQYTYIPDDITGWAVVTDRPAMVISMSSESILPKGTSDTTGSFLMTQVPPTSSLGRKHIVPPNEYETTDTATGVFFIVRAVPAFSNPTFVTTTFVSSVNGTNTNTNKVHKGQFHEMLMTENVPVLVECSRPCIAVRYIANGQFSAMNIIHDVTKAWTYQKFSVPTKGKLVVVTEKTSVTSLQINGSPATPTKTWTAPGTPGIIAVYDVPTLDVTLTSAANDVPMLAWVSEKGSNSMYSLTLTQTEYLTTNHQTTLLRDDGKFCPAFLRSGEYLPAVKLSDMVVPRVKCWTDCINDFWCHYTTYNYATSDCTFYTTSFFPFPGNLHGFELVD